MGKPKKKMKLDLLEGVFFLFSPPFFLLWRCAGQAWKARKQKVGPQLIILKQLHPDLTCNPKSIVLPGIPICVSELGSNRVSEAWKFSFSSHVSLSEGKTTFK